MVVSGWGVWLTVSTAGCRRLGSGKAGIKEIFKHPWFAKVNWVELEKGKTPAPFVPDVRDDTDVSNFDEVQPEDMHTDFSDPCHDITL